jgi:hypothetical protein
MYACIISVSVYICVVYVCVCVCVCVCVYTHKHVHEYIYSHTHTHTHTHTQGINLRQGIKGLIYNFNGTWVKRTYAPWDDMPHRDNVVTVTTVRHGSHGLVHETIKIWDTPSPSLFPFLPFSPSPSPFPSPPPSSSFQDQQRERGWETAERSVRSLPHSEAYPRSLPRSLPNKRMSLYRSRTRDVRENALYRAFYHSLFRDGSRSLPHFFLMRRLSWRPKVGRGRERGTGREGGRGAERVSGRGGGGGAGTSWEGDQVVQGGGGAGGEWDVSDEVFGARFGSHHLPRDVGGRERGKGWGEERDKWGFGGGVISG